MTNGDHDPGQEEPTEAPAAARGPDPDARLSDVRKDLENLAETLPDPVSFDEAWNQVSEAMWSAFEEMKRDHPLPPDAK